MLCFIVVMQSFIMNSHEEFIHIHQGCFAGTGAIARLPQCQWSKPDGYGEISQCITTTKRSKTKNGCIFLGIYCTYLHQCNVPGFQCQEQCLPRRDEPCPCPNSKVYGANIGPNWVLLASRGPHLCPINLAFRVFATGKSYAKDCLG